MGRNGLEYFPHDCKQDDKLALIEVDFGLKGYAIVWKILERIYYDEGYYVKWTNEVISLFSWRNKVGNGIVSEVTKKALEVGLFDKDLFNQYEILTSHGIQKRFLNSAKRRKDVELIGDYTLLTDEELAEAKNVRIM